jgi:hypothetical protein
LDKFYNRLRAGPTHLNRPEFFKWNLC